MSEDVFTEPADPAEQWTDVRMTDPAAGEWDVDVVVANGSVEYVDLRVRPAFLEGFIDCLIDDVGADRAREVLQTVARRQGIDLADEEGDA